MNKFEQACIQASKNNWCWCLSCTTCGQWDFTNFFMELCESDDRWNLSLDMGVALETFIDADIKNISATCKYPDWLGYLGVVLFKFDSQTPSFGKLSQSWASHLINLVKEDSHAYQHLTDVINGNARLSPRSMEMCEHTLLI